MKACEDLGVNAHGVSNDFDSGSGEEIVFFNDTSKGSGKKDKSARRKLDDYFERKSLEDKLLDY